MQERKHLNRTAGSGRSIYYLAGAMIIFGTIGIFRRLVSLPSDALAFGRGIIGGVFLLAIMKIRGQRFSLAGAGRKSILMLILTGAMIGFNWILLFEAYNYTTVAIATLCYYMAPVIVVILSPLVLKESVSGRQILCVFISLFGMILVSGVIGDTGNAGVSSTGVFLGLGAAVLYAAVVLLNKQIEGVPVYEKTVIQLLSAAGALLPYMIAKGTLTNYHLSLSAQILFLTVCIVHTGIAYAMYFGAIEKLPARTCALFSYIDPVTAVLLSVLILGEAMTWYGAVGTILILGSAVYSELGKR